MPGGKNVLHCVTGQGSPGRARSDPLDSSKSGEKCAEKWVDWIGDYVSAWLMRCLYHWTYNSCTPMRVSQPLYSHPILLVLAGNLQRERHMTSKSTIMDARSAYGLFKVIENGAVR